MKIKYKGPAEKVIVGGFGPHLQGEEKNYPEGVAKELLAGKRQQFEAAGCDPSEEKKPATPEEKKPATQKKKKRRQENEG